MKQEQKSESVIPRNFGAKIERVEKLPENIRHINETAYAAEMGHKPHEVKSLFKDVYEFYQNNEV